MSQPAHRPRRRPRYAEIASTLALVIAVGGTAHAVAATPARSVGTADLKNGAVTTPKLAGAAVTHAKIAPNAVSLKNVVGADVSTTVDLSLLAGDCLTEGLDVPGAVVGQMVFMSFLGTTPAPAHLLAEPRKISTPGSMIVSFCNTGTVDLTITGLGVRLVTLG